MKKLNQNEMRVLADRISKDLRKQANEAQAELDKISDEMNREKAQNIIAELKHLSKDARDMAGIKLENFKIDKILQRMRPTQTKINRVNWWDKSDIIDELIIGQITSPDIDSLCNMVASRFIKK